MKADITRFVAQCLTCQVVKAEHQRPVGLLQPLPIPEWKWEHIAMDFVVGLPKTTRGNDAIWVIVDRLTKSAHFLPFRVNASLDKLAQLYMDEHRTIPWNTSVDNFRSRSSFYLKILARFADRIRIQV